MTVLRLTLLCVFLGVGGMPLLVYGQAPDSVEHRPDSTGGTSSAVVERVEGAFADGDASRLLVPSADRVEISLFGTRTYYSSSQALYVLREFFRSHVPQRFRVRDVMETETSCFVQGKYRQARVEQRLDVYVRLGQTDGDESWYLEEVSIEAAPE